MTNNLKDTATEEGEQMYEVLPRRLKAAADRYEKEHPIIGVGELRPQDAMQDAACAIESLTDQLTALQSENGLKDKEIVRLKLEKELMRQEWDTSQATLSSVEAERDAALRDVPHDCEHCKTGDCYIRNGTEHCHWLWRGAQGEGQETKSAPSAVQDTTTL